MNNNSVLVTDLELVKETRPTFLAIGVFDGVDLGHQRMIQNMVAAAKAANANSAILTFFPHPSAIIHDRQGRLYLTTLQERITLLSILGLDMVITQTFDDRLRLTPAAVLDWQCSPPLWQRDAAFRCGVWPCWLSLAGPVEGLGIVS